MSMDVDGWAEAEATGVGGWVSGRDWWMSDRPDLGGFTSGTHRTPDDGVVVVSA